jgi:DNA-3-methyladenine glycosylase II
VPKRQNGPVGRPRYWNKATTALGDADQVLAGVIERHPQGCLAGQGDAYGTLARSIVAQQVSVRSAESVWRRLEALVGTVSPDTVGAKSEVALRAAGLTRQKARYLRDLAVDFAEGRMGPERWVRRDDDAVIEALMTVRGVGRWTAEMFLIFHLLRPDVLPLADIGLQRAVGKHYANGERLTAERIAALAEAWRPWRSVATWYLWRSLDPLPVSY